MTGIMLGIMLGEDSKLNFWQYENRTKALEVVGNIFEHAHLLEGME